MKISIIPARGGSKRIPRKNIRNFAGKPMIAHAIQIARESQLFDHIIVSTDDIEIAAIARQWGACTPFERPAELANDFAGTTEVIAHGTEWAIAQGWKLEAVCCLYATTPFVEVDDLVAGWKALKSDKWFYSFAVTEFASPIFRSFQQTKEGGVKMFFPEHFSKRSQDLPTALHDAGQFYWGLPQAWLEQKRLFERHSIPVFIPRDRVVDIDTEEDWRQAELMWDVMQRRNKTK
ncbi:pseudaminic acid CMP-transferase [[Leptolyngbya] sp. PCC 7376]|uniref:pseudaminic acid cytidylyltransferase n=1 Tax=[Leptolyngbya] sp. PCC 7376 TaxID=111781 RepID=UPI00029F1A75|nr:pseudaminic acid cytidylyltransferase [[Leptolyngbya] sp. PCC 7376]AFY36532.1 pseudaminic acid CMP-transferase [[Leptolyngbya] sp. PCC 7376]